jgi:hypothetical protein
LARQVNVLCDALAGQYAAGKSSNLYLGFRCYATDVLMLFCYNKCLDTTNDPDFHADLVIASESMLPILSLAKYSGFLVTLLHYFPAWLAKNLGSSVLAALFRLREVRLFFFSIRRAWWRQIPGGADLLFCVQLSFWQSRSMPFCGILRN